MIISGTKKKKKDEDKAPIISQETKKQAVKAIGDATGVNKVKDIWKNGYQVGDISQSILAVKNSISPTARLGSKASQFIQNTVTDVAKGGGNFIKGTKSGQEIKDIWSDGWQFGDVAKTQKSIAKTILGTQGDVVANLAKGELQTAEGLVDTGRYLVSDVAKATGNNLLSAKAKANAMQNTTGFIFGENDLYNNPKQDGWLNKLDKYSVVGNQLDNAVQSIGQQMFRVGLQNAMQIGGATEGQVKLANKLEIFTGSYGTSKSQALMEGADDTTATIKGIIGGTSEYISENLFDNIPEFKTGGVKGFTNAKNIIGNSVEKAFGKNAGKAVVKIFNGMGEGIEEGISNGLETALTDLTNVLAPKIAQLTGSDYQYTYGMKEGQGLNEDNFGDNVLKLFEDTLGSAFSKESGEAFLSAMISTIVFGGMISGMDNSQRNKAINAYAQDNNISEEKAHKLFDGIRDLKLQQSIDSETNYGDKVELEEQIEKNLTQELQNNPNLNLQELQEGLINRDKFTKAVGTGIVSSRGLDLNESYKAYNGDAKYKNEIANIQKFMNNRNIDARFDSTMFDNNEQNAIWTTQDGKDAVIFNPNASADQVIQNIATHEMTHDIINQKTEAGTSLFNDVLENIKSQENYAEQRKEIEDLYAKYYDRNSEDFSAKVDEEMVANELGKNLGTQEYINRLVNEKPNLARRIYNWVVDKLDNIGKSAEYKEQKAYWKSVADKFEVAYNEQKTATGEDKTAYSMSDKYMWHSSSQENIDNIRKYGFRYDKESSYFATNDDISKNYGADKIMLEQGKFNLKDVTQELEETDNRQLARNTAKEEGYDGIKYRTSKDNYDIEITNIDKLNEVVKQTEEENAELLKALMGETTTKYSLATNKDSTGKTLSKEQQEYFKDSKVVDENGNLQVVYHGSPNEFTVFDKGRMKTGATLYASSGDGFYFTDSEARANKYSKDGYKYSTYLNITNPFVVENNLTPEANNVLTEFSQQVINNHPEATQRDFGAYELFDKNNIGQQSGTAILSNVVSEYGNEFTDFLKSKGYDGIKSSVTDYDNFGEKYNYVAFEPNQIKNIDNTTPTTNPDIRYSITKDNTGRELSEGQREYFKNSKAVDDDGNLITVYHTMTDTGIQFNEFNPVGTDYYKFGDQVVNFFTDSQEMSGSYANQYYEMADTKKINSLDEAKEWLNGQKTTLSEYGIKELETGYALTENGQAKRFFNDKENLLKNLKQVFYQYNEQFGDKGQAKYQYEGYVNIENPYIIDAEGRYWNKIESKGDTTKTLKLINTPANIKQELIDMANDSIHKFDETFFAWKQADNATTYVARDRTNVTLEQRLLNRMIHEIDYQDVREILDGKGSWGKKISFMDYLHHEDLITEKEWQEFDKSDVIPQNVLKRIDDKLNEPLRYEDRYLANEMEVLGLPLEIKETTLNELWKTREEAYKAYDENGRDESSQFVKKMLQPENEQKYSKYGNIDDLFYTAKNDFTDEFIRDKYNDWSVTNDIVQKIIDLNKYGENYDGLIMKNVVDYGGNAENKAPHDLYITFNSNQFKAVDNLNPTEDADIRYSMQQDVEPETPGTRTTMGELFNEIAPIRQDLSNITEQMNNLSNQIETLQEGLKNTQQGYVETYNQLRNENIPTRQVTEEEANTLQDALMNDEGYLKSLEEQADFEENNVKLAKTITDNVQNRLALSKKQRESLENIINDAIDNDLTTDEISDKLYKAFARQEYTYTNDEAKEVKKILRRTPIKVSDAIKKDIADYGDLQRRNFNKINFSKTGLPVDVAYAQFVETLPGYFSEDIINPSDQLLKMIDVANMAEEYTDSFEIPFEEFDNMADFVKSTILNNQYNNQVESQENLEKTIQFDLNDEITPTTIRTQESIDDYIENRDIAPVSEENNQTTNNAEKQQRIDNMTRSLKEKFINRNYVIDETAKATGNKYIKFAGDALNNVSGEAQYNVHNKQTDFDGNWIGKGLDELFEPAKKAGLENVYNDYLFNLSNIERHAVGKGSEVPLAVSQQLVRQYEQEYPELKEMNKELYKFEDNLLQEQVDAGLITQEQYDNYRGEHGIFRSYVPFYPAEIDRNRYFDNEGNIRAVSTLKRAKGGAGDVNTMLPVEQAIAKQVYASKRAIRANELYKQLVSSLEKYDSGMDIDVRENPTNLDDSLYVTPEGDKILSAYFDGQKVSAKISDELYNELSGDNEARIRQLEEDFSLITNPLQKASNIRRNLLTTWNPTFLARNMIKDIQDSVINSKHTKDMLSNYFGMKPGQKSALFELRDAKTKEAQQFLALYGVDNLYGDYSNLSKSKNLVNRFARINELIELAPRFAEFKASLDNGESVQEAIYNAREVTTNFGRGGYITKALNRNGFTFLNANIQGLDKLVRNLSGENGVKGVTSVVVKGALFALLPSIINEILYGFGDDKDEDYEALPNYIKDNYYLIKTEGNKFVRIPKGRINSAFGSLARRTVNAIEGEENPYEGWTKNAWDQIGVGDLGSNNILAPITQAFGSPNGKAWYGGDIVPTRLQNKPAGEQTDAKIDALSNTIGEMFNVSPYKVNYVLDQYSGGIGDILLPMITPETKSGAEKPHEYLLAPIKDAFVVNSTDDNKYAGEFYDAKDKAEIQSNSDYASDEDELRYKYMSSVSTEMSKLYKERREVQADTTLGNKEKYAKVQLIQNEINNLAKEAMNTYNNFSNTENYSSIGDFEYYKNDEGKWTKVSDDEMEFTSGLNDAEKTAYYKTKNKISGITQDYTAKTKDLAKDDPKKTQYSAERKDNITRAIVNSGLDNYTKAMVYSKYYSNKDTMTNVVNAGYNVDTYITALNDIEQLRDTYSKKNGYTTEQRKAKTIAYINSLDMEVPQKAMLIRNYYTSFRTYNDDIVNFVGSLNIPYEDKKAILEGTGMSVNGNRITWK